MAGYSKKGLADKLGLKPGAKTLFIGAPEGYERTLGALPDGTGPFRNSRVTSAAKGSDHGFIQFFCRKGEDLEKAFPPLKAALGKAGMLWVSWPKKTALSKEDAKDPDMLDENKVRAIGLEAGLVDVKVCAVDEVWSGLKFVYRLADR